MLASNTGWTHAGAIADLLADADEIVIAIAFLKKGGAFNIRPLIDGRLTAGVTGCSRTLLAKVARERRNISKRH